ncbi:transcription termination/antitermination protein NusA [Candidatus Parcubacteria bacterium]|nr:MAG: transcription termination/antitermination protein NusA [Candidatus Parcubacteria bacterium]
MKEITNAIKQICDEKQLEYDAVIETIESALAAAYRKDFGKKNQNIKVEFAEEITKSKIYDVKTVVDDLPEEELQELEEGEAEEKEDNKKEKKEDKKIETVKVEEDGEEEERKFNHKTDIQISDAKMIKKTVKVGDELKIKLETPPAYGRMAAQTAKQVIIQKLREAEREMVFSEFKDKEGEVVSGSVQRREGSVILVDLGKSVGVLPMDEQIRGEKYLPGERIKVYVKQVSLKPRGPEILLSRTSEEILKKIFYLEIPEISNGLIDLKGVAREAGARSKVAVFTDSENVDPIGSCVGQRGARIQTIITELGGEKVDIIEYDDDPVAYISNALSPAKIIKVETDEESKKAKVFVSSDQLSLAIGKSGQNARLAAKLTGWNIDVLQLEGEEDNDDTLEEKELEEKAEIETEAPTEEK